MYIVLLSHLLKLHDSLQIQLQVTSYNAYVAGYIIAAVQWSKQYAYMSSQLI